jgi:peptidoglycan/xylan/chitin deacetylase (PgdA/CDA1 family)
LITAAAAFETAAVAAGMAAAGASVLTVAALAPQSQIFGQTLVAGRDPAEFALTFDDGPNDRATGELLDLLAERGVQATFFMMGRFVRRRPELARQVLAAGHVVGNHTVTHPWLAWQTAARIREEMGGCNRILEDVLGAPVRYFRPPHGARRPAVFSVAKELGLTVVQWNVMGQDWRPIGAEGILANVRRGMKRAAGAGRGANILLHDGSDRAMGADRNDTVSAVRSLLQETARDGRRAVTVEAWG